MQQPRVRFKVLKPTLAISLFVYLLLMVTMEETHQKQEPEFSSPCVFEIPGEPAVAIDGVPDISPNVNALVPVDIANESESNDSHGLGEWLKGREVRKMFGDQYFSGKVVSFDAEMKWYKVEYEDGDFEDLEWRELQEVLLPLDITISLKSLALKIFKPEKSVCLSGENTVRSRRTATKNVTSKKKNAGENHKTSVMKSEGNWQMKEYADYEDATSKKKMARENHNTSVTRSEGNWQMKEYADYEGTTQVKINMPTGGESHKPLLTKTKGGWQIQENAYGITTTQVKTNMPMGEENHKSLVRKAEGGWQIKENAGCGRTTQVKIDRSREIRRTINAEKQKRKIRNAVESRLN